MLLQVLRPFERLFADLNLANKTEDVRIEKKYIKTSQTWGLRGV